MADKRNFKRIHGVYGEVHIEVSLDRFSRQYQDAQIWLDKQVMINALPYIPHVTGTLVNLTKMRSASLAGTGLVCIADGPYGQYLYNGKVMVDPETGSPWARKDAKKVVTDRDLTYSNPKTVPFYFDVEKRKNIHSWVKGVKKIAGGG